MENDIIRSIAGKYVINKVGDALKNSEGSMLCIGCVFDMDNKGCSEALTHKDPIMINKVRLSLCESRESIWRINTLEENKKPRRKLTLNTSK